MYHISVMTILSDTFEEKVRSGVVVVMAAVEDKR